MDTKAKRSYGLDFLKVLATLVIVFHHYQQVLAANFETGINFWGDWFYWGYIVEFFFILSGYFMYRYVNKIYNGSIRFFSWCVLRARRLLPLVGVSAVVFELCIYIYNEIYGLSYYDMNITLWGTLITSLGLQEGGVFANPVVNNPTWYISVLMACYAVFYIVTWICSRLKVSPFYAYAGMILLGCGVITYGIHLPFLNSQIGRGYYSFFFGLLLSHFVHRHGITRNVILLSSSLFVFLTYIFVRRPIMVQNDLAYILTFIMYPAIILIFETPLVKWVFRNPIWGTLGQISFDVFIWHNPLFNILFIIMAHFQLTINFSNW